MLCFNQTTHVFYFFNLPDCVEIKIMTWIYWNVLSLYFIVPPAQITLKGIAILAIEELLYK